MKHNQDAILGALLREAFFDDQPIRVALLPVNRKLNKISEKLRSEGKFQLAGAASGAFNMFIVSAYHCSRAAELLVGRPEYFQQPDFGDFFLTIQHSFGLDSVFGLSSSRSFLLQETILQQLVVTSKSVDDVYAKHLPRLVDARDSLAHEDERILGKSNKLREFSEKTQMTAKFGSKFKHLLDRDLAEFDFDFSSNKIVSMVASIGSLVGAN